jgi:uncharacterized protein YceH (UPF0502 family)
VELTPVQVRILGCLVEKEQATPANYPLTMNSLLAACNQTTNRHPVVTLSEATVRNALENLRAANLIRIDYSRSNRAEKYRHVLEEALQVDDEQLVVLSVIMLRGPQTPAEIRARAERLWPFRDHQQVEAVLARLAARTAPLVVRLERLPGQKEARWAHLLGGHVSVEDLPAPPQPAQSPRIDRLGALEAAVEALSDRVERLQTEHDELAARIRPLLD